MDIIAAIDRITGCHLCGKSLEGSASDDFCSERCQQAWQAEHVAGLRGADSEVTFAFEVDTSGLTASITAATAALERIRARCAIDTGQHSISAGTQLFRSDGDRWELFGTVAADVTFEELR